MNLFFCHQKFHEVEEPRVIWVSREAVLGCKIDVAAATFDENKHFRLVKRIRAQEGFRSGGNQ